MRIGALIASFLILLFSPFLFAQDWIVQPNTCIVEKEGESCNATINIVFPDTISGPHCLMVMGKKQHCWSDMPKETSFPLAYDKPVKLKLIDQQSHTLFESQLSIKVVIQQRRRIRAPWSFF